VDEGGVSGTKTFEYTLIPTKEGQYTIPGISWSYYDTRKKDYVTLHSKEFSLNVLPGDPVIDTLASNLGGKTPISGGQDPGHPILITTLIVLPLLLAGGGFLLWKKKKAKEKAEAEEKAKQEEQAAAEEPPPPPKPREHDPQQVIGYARTLLLHGNVSGSVSFLYESLLNAICLKCEMSREEASVHNLRYRINSKNFSAERTEELLGLLEQLSRWRYTPGEVNPATMNAAIGKVQQWLVDLW